MQTVRDRIIEFLSKRQGGIDDDELAKALNLRQRQQANSRCRQLVDEGLIERKVVDGKINNFWKGSYHVIKTSSKQENVGIISDDPWYWEGNVQNKVADYLKREGYSIIKLADTRSRETGKDIEARNDPGFLWVTVKGYPKGTPRTAPSTQAGHWFKQALFDIVAWRGENEKVQLALALPDFPRYRKLAEKVAWFQPVARFSYIWVQEDGRVLQNKGVRYE